MDSTIGDAKERKLDCVKIESSAGAASETPAASTGTSGTSSTSVKNASKKVRISDVVTFITYDREELERQQGGPRTTALRTVVEETPTELQEHEMIDKMLEKLTLDEEEGFALHCKTCRERECYVQKIEKQYCNESTPELPFQIEYEKRYFGEAIEYACLDLEYYTGKILRKIQQCAAIPMQGCVCTILKKVAKIRRCSFKGLRTRHTKREIENSLKGFNPKVDDNTNEFDDSDNTQEEDDNHSPKYKNSYDKNENANKVLELSTSTSSNPIWANHYELVSQLSTKKQFEGNMSSPVTPTDKGPTDIHFGKTSLHPISYAEKTTEFFKTSYDKDNENTINIIHSSNGALNTEMLTQDFTATSGKTANKSRHGRSSTNEAPKQESNTHSNDYPGVFNDYFTSSQRKITEDNNQHPVNDNTESYSSSMDGKAIHSHTNIDHSEFRSNSKSYKTTNTENSAEGIEIATTASVALNNNAKLTENTIGNSKLTNSNDRGLVNYSTAFSDYLNSTLDTTSHGYTHTEKFIVTELPDAKNNTKQYTKIVTENNVGVSDKSTNITTTKTSKEVLVSNGATSDNYYKSERDQTTRGYTNTEKSIKTNISERRTNTQEYTSLDDSKITLSSEKSDYSTRSADYSPSTSDQTTHDHRGTQNSIHADIYEATTNTQDYISTVKETNVGASDISRDNTIATTRDNELINYITSDDYSQSTTGQTTSKDPITEKSFRSNKSEERTSKQDYTSTDKSIITKNNEDLVNYSTTSVDQSQLASYQTTSKDSRTEKSIHDDLPDGRTNTQIYASTVTGTSVRFSDISTDNTITTTSDEDLVNYSTESIDYSQSTRDQTSRKDQNKAKSIHAELPERRTNTPNYTLTVTEIIVGDNSIITTSSEDFQNYSTTSVEYSQPTSDQTISKNNRTEKSIQADLSEGRTNKQEHASTDNYLFTTSSEDFENYSITSADYSESTSYQTTKNSQSTSEQTSSKDPRTEKSNHADLPEGRTNTQDHTPTDNPIITTSSEDFVNYSTKSVENSQSTSEQTSSKDPRTEKSNHADLPEGRTNTQDHTPTDNPIITTSSEDFVNYSTKSVENSQSTSEQTSKYLQSKNDQTTSKDSGTEKSIQADLSEGRTDTQDHTSTHNSIISTSSEEFVNYSKASGDYSESTSDETTKKDSRTEKSIQANLSEGSINTQGHTWRVKKTTVGVSDISTDNTIATSRDIDLINYSTTSVDYSHSISDQTTSKDPSTEKSMEADLPDGRTNTQNYTSTVTETSVSLSVISTDNTITTTKDNDFINDGPTFADYSQSTSDQTTSEGHSAEKSIHADLPVGRTNTQNHTSTDNSIITTNSEDLVKYNTSVDYSPLASDQASHDYSDTEKSIHTDPPEEKTNTKDYISTVKEINVATDNTKTTSNDEDFIIYNTTSVDYSQSTSGQTTSADPNTEKSTDADLPTGRTNSQDYTSTVNSKITNSAEDLANYNTTSVDYSPSSHDQVTHDHLNTKKSINVSLSEGTINMQDYTSSVNSKITTSVEDLVNYSTTSADYSPSTRSQATHDHRNTEESINSDPFKGRTNTPRCTPTVTKNTVGLTKISSDNTKNDRDLINHSTSAFYSKPTQNKQTHVSTEKTIYSTYTEGNMATKTEIPTTNMEYLTSFPTTPVEYQTNQEHINNDKSITTDIPRGESNTPRHKTTDADKIEGKTFTTTFKPNFSSPSKMTTSKHKNHDDSYILPTTTASPSKHTRATPSHSSKSTTSHETDGHKFTSTTKRKSDTTLIPSASSGVTEEIIANSSNSSIFIDENANPTYAVTADLYKPNQPTANMIASQVPLDITASTQTTTKSKCGSSTVSASSTSSVQSSTLKIITTTKSKDSTTAELKDESKGDYHYNDYDALSFSYNKKPPKIVTLFTVFLIIIFM
ncbi:serine-rich adhesin for platelets-like [Cylas formicarius]|uniref:serine-rich adhesin for platelets-like n=1 Tax=Cylas formicarius TaxID=197179 RepID=UPI002958B001|nr:serine-rich adhesin for platelets-like [Cylas formicarius]